MTKAGDLDSGDEAERLRDEIEQLRTSLETALEDNDTLTAERDRLVRRLADQARALQGYSEDSERVSRQHAAELAGQSSERERQAESDEELRVAFEELQVLTEELEAANNALQHNNRALDRRVEERTRELAAANGALAESERRFRTLAEGMPQLVWRSADKGAWSWASPQWCDYTGLSMEASLGAGWLSAFHADDRNKARSAWAEARAGSPLDFEGRVFNVHEQRYRHFATRASSVEDDHGKVVEWLGTSTDVDDILQLQQEQRILVAELQHRTRNLMAIVQSVVARTVRGAATLDEFEKCLRDRLNALARVQSLLSRRQSGVRVAFDVLLREELSVHRPIDETGHGAQISLSGPAGVPLRSGLVQTLALALHELATNAVKYGALGTPEGHLNVTWNIRENETGASALHVDWRETGVTMPAADAPARGGGYGRELIERALPYQMMARTSYVLEPEGVHCTIEVEIPIEDKAG
jgi:PAS domain S-box-containing protein